MDEGSVIALGPLPDDEARRLLAAASEAAPLRTHEVEAIVERAGGSPLYLEELLTIARGAGGLEGGLPDSLDAVVGAEIDALPPLTRRLLRYASVLGRSFRPEVLREVIAGEVVALDEVTREQLRAPPAAGRERAPRVPPRRAPGRGVRRALLPAPA